MLFSLLVNHFIVPDANKERLAFEEKYYRDVMVVEDYHAEYPGNQSVYFSNFNNRDKRINDFTFQQWGENNKPEYFIKSRYALNAPGSHDWTLRDVYVKDFNDDFIDIRHLKSLDTTFNFTISRWHIEKAQLLQCLLMNLLFYQERKRKRIFHGSNV